MLSLGTLYFISEWLVRIAMLVYVPQRRTPASARAWLPIIPCSFGNFAVAPLLRLMEFDTERRSWLP